jgi:hypothetical protein
MIGLVLVLGAVIAGPPGPPARCDAGQAPWGDRCMEPNSWLPDEARCPDGVVLFPTGEEKPRCLRCDAVKQQQPLRR